MNDDEMSLPQALDILPQQKDLRFQRDCVGVLR